MGEPVKRLVYAIRPIIVIIVIIYAEIGQSICLGLIQVLRWNEKYEASGAEAKEDEPQEDTISTQSTAGQNCRKNFLQDPAELRVRAEQRRISKRGGGGWGAREDVVGKLRQYGSDI